MRYQRYVSADDQQITVFTDNGPVTFHRHRVPDTLSDDTAHGGHVAPMNGTIMEVLVTKGDTVEKDQAACHYGSHENGIHHTCRS